MSRRLRVTLFAGSAILTILALLGTGVYLVLSSEWLRVRIRQRIVSELERATGGRVESGPLSFRWRGLEARLDGLVLHGTEPEGSPPLFQANTIIVGLRIISLFERKIDVYSVEVRRPQIGLILHPDGSTNIPHPRVRRNTKPVLETILDLAVKHFVAQNGVFMLAGQGRTPFHIQADDLLAKLAFQAFGSPRYVGNVTAKPVQVQWGTFQAAPANANIDVAIERNRILIPRATLSSGASSAEANGEITDLATSARADFRYTARLDVPQWAETLRLRGVERGQVDAAGTLQLERGQGLRISGRLHGSRIAIRQGAVRLVDLHGDAALRADPARARITQVRFAGVTQVPVTQGSTNVPMRGQIADVIFRDGAITATGIQLAAMGGTFAGGGEISSADRYMIEGQINEIEVRTLAALGTDHALPYNGRISGHVKAIGSLKSRRDLAADAQITLSPEPGGPAMRGEISMNYDARAGTLHLGPSYVQLPSTLARASGTLGSVIQVHLQSTDLSDVTPILDLVSSTAPVKLPVTLAGGRALFDGTMRGTTDAPLIAGRAELTRFVIEGRNFDSFESQMTVSQSQATFQNATLVQDSVRVQLSGNVGLNGWKADAKSPITAQVRLRGAPIAELVKAAGAAGIEARGSMDLSAQVSGSVSDPRIEATVNAAQGSLEGEAFDRVSAQLRYAGDQAQVASAELTAGGKQAKLAAAYRHAPDDLRTGVLTFQLSTNAMPVGQVQTVASRLPGVEGELQVTAQGSLRLANAGGRITWRIVELNGDISARKLERQGLAFGDFRATASTKGSQLLANVTSNFADAVISGSGQWQLSDGYPGRMQLSVSEVDFFKVQQRLNLHRAGGFQLSGSAQAEAAVTGPLLEPKRWNGSARITQLRVGPAPSAPLLAAERTPEFLAHNSAPINLRLANSEVLIQDARLVGRNTDVAISGKVSFIRPEPLDVRVAGRVDLAMLQDFDPDITASGFLVTDAAIRGSMESPVISGRLETKNSSVNYADFPTGLSNINAVALFSGTGATIQTFTAQSGGGTVRLTGFGGFEGGQPVFRLHANAKQVRVRYPPGVSTVADASITWTGTAQNNMATGTITVNRVGFNPQSDLGTILAASAQPVRTPAARTGLLAGIHFDIQVQTSPDITFQSSLAQDMVLEANLRIRGTEANPAMVGRINIMQGQLTFFGTKYNINQGSVSFYNPVRIEPVLNVDLETRARGVDVILNVSGTPSKLALTPRSDPPLPFNEIVALLATGHTPTSTQTGLATGQLANSGSSWQQAGASALLAEAVANPVAGRLQRFFGITKLRIDPTMPGVEFNPQARITIEQQITPNITFTYITNVTQSNPLVVQVEWAVNPRWSIVAVRDENGLFGLDFFFKKRFR